MNFVDSPNLADEAPLNGCQNEEECEYDSRQRVGRSNALAQKRQVECGRLPKKERLNCQLFMGKRGPDFSRKTYERFANPLQLQDPDPKCTKFTCRFNPSGKKKFMVKKGVRVTAPKEDSMGDVTSDTNSKACTNPADLFCYGNGAGRKRSVSCPYITIQLFPAQA